VDDEETKASSSRMPATPLPVQLPVTPLRVPARPSTPPSIAPGSQTGTSGTTVGSPLEALERDEILRTRKFCYIAVAIGVGGGASVPLLPGDPTASVMIMVGVGVAITAALFLLNRTRDPVAFRKPSTALGWFLPAAAVTTGIPFFGSFSPVAVVLVLGIYFVGLGRSGKLAAACYAACAGMQALVSMLVITGGRDTGIIRAPDLTPFEQVVVQALVQMVFLCTLITARMSRRTALAAVGELERQVRLAAHREALLLEAQQELERALRPGRGKFSDQSLGGYQLGLLLGRGAMGEVYEATGPRGTVAIKLLSQASLGNPNHVMRFLRELRVAAGIDSPNVVRVVDIGEQPVPYLVMERLEGQTLAEILRGKRSLSTGDVVEMVRQVGAGVTAAAAAGIVHRDLKPQNVYRDRATWKILDFGVARAIEGGDTLTQGHVVGTPSYMAPEQASGGTIDHRTDLYALAAIAYRALTGQAPYSAGEVAETLYKVVHSFPRRPTDLAELPPDVDLVLAVGLAKQSAERFSSADEFANALVAAFGPGLPPALRRRGEALEVQGAWRKTPRASTARMRAP
jgi:serine/threonine-protein kinase